MSDLPPPPPPPPSYTPPPNYVPYAPYNVAPAARPIGTLAKWLVGLTVVGIATQLGALALQIMVHNNASDFLDGVITDNTFTDKLAPYLAVAGLAALAGAAQIVLLIIWTFRMARNAQSLGRVDQKFRPGATIAINLLGSITLGILPFFMWRELWRVSDPDAAPGDPSWRQRAVSPLIPLHLGLGLASVATGLILGANRIFNQFNSSNDNTDIAEQLRDQLPMIIISSLLAIAASAVFVMIIRQMSARHMRAIGEG